MRSRREIVGRFAQTYATQTSDAHAAVQREVFGIDAWVRGYTTPAQADLLAQRLGLRGGVRLLDVGAGQGWPSLHLAKTTGCEAVLADVPRPGLVSALQRAASEQLADCCSFLLASGTHLPFRPRTFDAIVHTDTL
ncbi:MAG TPA: methyltransferase domain-containing protein [Dehalococcoidia bacterium]|nr:methyltransferase domain-containing protein [Dehalococcoidia bacterium]